MTTGRLLFEIALMFAAAKLAGALFERLRQPPVMGELLAGVALGTHALGWVGHSATHEVLQELGAVVLLFAVGLDTPLSELRAVGRRSVAVALAGVVAPFLAGWALLPAVGLRGDEVLLVATALVATSVGITARVLADLGRTRDPEARVILGAAVVDDVLGLLVLTAVAGAGASSGAEVVTVAAGALTFVALAGGLGPRAVRSATPLLDRIGERPVFVVALALCLGLSALAGALELAAIIGAFLAGMAFAETRDRYHLEERLAPVYALVVPFFFVVTGTLVDVSLFASGEVLGITAVVVAIAVATKLVACGAAAWGMGLRSAVVVGVGMVPRGEVGVLVASVGLHENLIDGELYGVVVAMSLVTTLVVPPVLAALLPGAPERPRGPRGPEIEGIGG